MRGGTRPPTETAKLTAADGAGGDGFGVSVAMSADGGVVVAGAPGGADGGSAYIFAKPAGGWASTSAAAKIAPRDGEYGDAFGASVSVGADVGMIIACSPRDSFYDSKAGSAYAFEVDSIERRDPTTTLAATGPVTIVNEGGEAEFPVEMSAASKTVAGAVKTDAESETRRRSPCVSTPPTARRLPPTARARRRR